MINFTVLEPATSLAATSEVLQIAQQAFAAQQKGAIAGDWTDLLALMSEDVEFQPPFLAGLNGIIHGKQNVAMFLRTVTEEFNLKTRVTLRQPIVTNKTMVAYEFDSRGELRGEAIAARLVVFYEIENGKIKSFREYAGQS